MIADLAGWLAPAATIVAAMMTAANLGARLTGFGFVVFTVGSVCWIALGLSTGQTSLIVANTVLTVVNLIGIWRWLGRQRTYEDGANSARAASRKAAVPTLFPATAIAGMNVAGVAGDAIGKAVEALVECRSGTISYVVVSTPAAGLIGETLRAVPREAVVVHADRIVLTLQRSEFDALSPLAPGDWPACT
jgi:hypothetical protein